MSETKTVQPMLTKSYVSGQSEFSIPLEEGKHKITLLGYGARLKRTLDVNLRLALALAGGLNSPDTLINSDEVAEKIVNAAKGFGKTAFDVLWQFGYFRINATGEDFKTGVPKGMPKLDSYDIEAKKGTFDAKDAKGETVKRETMKFEVIAKVVDNPVNNANLPEVEELEDAKVD